MSAIQEHRQFSVKHLFAATARPRFMAVFVAYFDAGGDPRDRSIRAISVAGWVATETRWRTLERRWKAVCAAEGVTGLHMKEFAHSTGQYTEWKGDETRRARFLGALANIVTGNTSREFSESIFLDGYRAVDAQFEFHERVGHPYMIGAWLCIAQVLDWMRRRHPDDDVLFVFEKGDAYQAELPALLARDKIHLPHDPIFMEKAWRKGERLVTVPPLECADFLAYEHHKNLTDIYLKGRTKGRASLGALAKHFDQPSRRWHIADGRYFEKVATSLNVPRRVGVEPSPIPYEIDHIMANTKLIFHMRERPAPIPTL